MYRICISLFLLFFLFADVLHATVSIPEEESLAAWYRFYAGVSAQPFAEQLDPLKNYLQKHPGFERVYFKILNHYQAVGNTHETEKYFQLLVQKPECRRTSQWMLAHLYAKEERYKEALDALHDALQSEKPSFELCKDYFNFLSFSSIQPGENDTLFISGYDTQFKSLFYSFRDYYMANYSGVVHKIMPLLQTEMDNAMLLFVLSFSLVQTRDFARADSVIQVGLDLATKNQDYDYQVKFTYLEGYLELNKSNFLLAKSFYETALVKANIINDCNDKSYITESIASLYYTLQDYGNSLKYYQLALEMNNLYDMKEKTGVYYFCIGNIKYVLEQYSQALSWYDKSESELINKNNRLLLNIHLYKTMIYYNLLQYEMMEREYNKIINEVKNGIVIDQELSCELEEIKAIIYYSHKEYDKNRSVLLQLLPKYSSMQNNISKASCLAQIGTSWKEQHQYAQAGNYYRQAYKIACKTNNKITMAWYQMRAAECMAYCDNYELALSGIDSVIRVGNELNSKYLLRNAYIRKGRVYERAKNINQAIKSYQCAIPYTESPRDMLQEEEFRIGYFSDNYHGYRGLVRCFCNRYMQTGHPADLDSMLLYSEMQRGRALKDVINEVQVIHRSAENSPAYQAACNNLEKKQRDLRLQAGTRHNDEQWDKLMSSLEAAKYELITQKLFSPDSIVDKRVQISRKSPFTLNHLHMKLKQYNCGLVMYHIDEQGSFALVATQDTAGIVTLSVTPDSLLGMVNSLMLPLRNTDERSLADIPFNAAIAYKLYNCLFQPLSEQFVLPERLFIIPEGVLLNLPFEILLQQAPIKLVYTPTDAPDYAKDFLQYKHAFFYSPTSVIFREKRFTLPWKKNIMILANPYSGIEESSDKALQFRARTGWRFDPLPFADKEGQSIKQIARQAQLYNHERADEQVFIKWASHYNIVHFATHAFVDTSFDAFSGLILSIGKDSTDDGILMGYEIKSLQLDCDLVTLSACETGRGKYILAEGILGLPRLFLGAGARAVLISHWKVDDRFTSVLMPEFYRNYLQKKMTRADALAQSRRTILGTLVPAEGIHYQHPFFWGAFALYGDPGPAAINSTPVLVVFGMVLCVFVGTVYFYKKKKSD